MNRRRKPPPKLAPSLTLSMILHWADDHFQRTGKHPRTYAGPVIALDAPLAMNWRKVDNALRIGFFGLPGGHSLAGILESYRNVRKKCFVPPLTDEMILGWADKHHKLTGKWPTAHSGPVLDVPGEIWFNISQALRDGTRKLKGSRSLAKLIATGRNVRNMASVPKLTIPKILKMADHHHKATGKWPRANDGPILGYPGETWLAINSALDQGVRGLSGGSSLAEVLRVHRGRRNKSNLPKLIEKEIFLWAKAYFDRTGKWPTPETGPIVESPGETWKAVSMALVQGLRGFPGGSSLARVLRKYRGKQNEGLLQ